MRSRYVAYVTVDVMSVIQPQRGFTARLARRGKLQLRAASSVCHPAVCPVRGRTAPAAARGRGDAAMPDIEYWIQLENRAWDVAPNNIDRLTGRTMAQLPGG